MSPVARAAAEPPAVAAAAVAGVLGDSTYQSIKDAILGNRLRPGTKLTHRMLTESLGVSRTPVRESLERLCQEGYVTRVLNRGYFVAEIDEREVRDLYQTREALESFALRLVLQRGVSARELKPIQTINARYGVLCNESLSRERVLVDREFHLTLAALSGNAHLVRTLEGLFDRIILKRRVEGFHETRGRVPYEDHVRLLDAIAKGHAEAAQKKVHEHIDGACARLLNYLGHGGEPA